MNRALYFAIKFGHIGPPPDSLITINEVSGEPEIDEPSVQYTSRMALAIQNAQNQGSLDAISLAAEIGRVRPEVYDNIDIDEFYRDYFRSRGGNDDHLVDVADRDAQREERVQREMEMLQAQEGAQMPSA